MTRKLLTALFFLLPCITFAQNDSVIVDTVYAYNNPLRQKKHFWKGAAETTGINVAVHCFDRFVMNEDFAKVNFNTIHHNLQT